MNNDLETQSLRVGLVTWNFPVISEPFVSTLALDLIAAGQQVRLLTFDTADKGDVIGTMHPEVERSDLLARTGRAGEVVPLRALIESKVPPLGLISALLPARRLGRAKLALREGPFDVVHCQFANLALAANGLRKAGLLRTRALVVHIRGNDISLVSEQRRRDAYISLFAEADLTIANCHYFRERAIALGCPPEKVIVIGSPIDGSLFAPPETRLPFEGRALRLIAVGRLVEKKGFCDAIAAVGLLRQQGREVVLDIYGEGQLLPELERQIAGLGLANSITLHGRATQAQILSGLHRADIAVAPCVRAASGEEDAPVNTLKEAMATGLPVVATRHGGIPELVIPGENGALVAERAPDELADAIAALADRPAEWTRLGEAGRARVLAEYDRLSVRDRTLAAYRACLASTRRQLRCSDDAMTRIRGAFISMMLSRQLVLAISGVGMMALARLLTPADFGIFATVLATFMLLEILIRFGLTEYLISAPRLSAGMLCSALGLSLAIASGVIALSLTFLLTPLSSWMAPDLRLGLLLMVPGLAAIPLSLVPLSVLKRRLEFGPVAWLNVATVTADVVVSIMLALLGAGTLALVAGLVASRISSAAILLATSRRLLRARWSGWRQFLAFAPRMTVNSLLPKASDLGVALIIPSALGVAALGLYNRSQTVVALLDRALLDGVGQVVLPAISDRLRAGASTADVYGAKTARMAVLIWPVFAVLGLLAEPVVMVLLGDQWTPAISVVRILCVAGLVGPFTSMSVHFFSATGHVERYLWIQASNQLVLIACVAIGALHSLEAVAWGIVLSKAMKALHIRRSIEEIVGPIGKAERLTNYLRAAAVALLSLAGPALLLAALPEGRALVLFVGGIGLAALGWVAGIVLTRHPLLDDVRTLPILTHPGLGPLRKILG